MDVRCEKCKTEYEFDDARISEAGVTVKCTSCGHVFKVKKKSLLLTVPVGQQDFDSRAPAAPPPPPAERPREWRVRQANGNMFTFKELTTLQKWIVERKVSRDDEISLTGESWKRLGNIAELASFFQVVEDAQRAQTMTPAPLGGPVVMTPPSGYGMPSVPPPPPPNSGAFPVPQPLGAPLPGSGNFAVPQAANPYAAPAPRRASHFPLEPLPMEMDDDFRKAGVKKGGALKWLLVLLFLGVLGGGGYYGYFYVWLPEQQRQAALEKEKDEAEAKLKSKETSDAEAKAKSDAEEKAKKDKEKADADAKAKLAAAQTAAEAPVDAGAVAKKEPVHDYDWYMARGDRLRESDRAEAALDAYGRAEEMEPDRSEAIAGKGLALLDMGRQPQAEAAFERALKLNPRYGVAVMGLAETYRAMGRKDEAVQYYEKYLDILPDSPEAAVARNAIQKLKQQ